MQIIKRSLISGVFFFSLSTLVNAQLPPEVQVDLLQEQIVDSLRAKDYSTVKEKILEYKKLGVAVPPAILLINAKIAIQEEDFQKGQSALEEYFNAGGKEHKSYQEALNLYKSVQPKAQAERDRQAALDLGPVKGYSSILLDADTGNVMHTRNADALRFPGSLTKMMTLYLSYDALNSGVLSLQEPLVVSNHAAAMPPVKLGVLAGDSLTVQQAIQAVAVRNANDISVVLAERIGGSEEGFVDLMNAKAAELGMASTYFTNPHGLPDAKQYTTAGDMANLASAMIKNHSGYYHYSGQKTFTYNSVALNNGNKLLHSLCGVDGLMISYTSASGYNQIISASRQNSRVIAVVIGGATGEARDKHAEDLLERGFDILGAPECVAKSDGVIATHFQPGDVGYEEALDLAARVKEGRSSHEVLTENNALKLELENARLKAELQKLKSTAASEDATPTVLLSSGQDTTNSTQQRAQSVSDNSSDLEPVGQKAYIVYVMDDGRPCTVVPKRKYYNSEVIETTKIWYFRESKSSQRFDSGIAYRVRGSGDDLSFSYENGRATIGDGHAKFCVHEFTDFESPEKFSKFVSQPLHSETIAGAKEHMYDELAKDYVIYKSLKAACEAFSATVRQSNYKHNAHCVGGLN